MKLSGLILAAVLAVAPAAMAQTADPAAAPAVARYPAKGGKTLTVTSPTFKAGGDIPFENTQYRGNTFPGLAWTKGPRGTVSYALIMQDTDLVIRGGPVLHWTLFNIPATVTRLPAGMTTQPAGASYGPNYKGAGQPYLGPRTPAGPKHHYHFQLFALDTALPEAAGSDFGVLTAALEGHVLASGELVGLGQRDPEAP